MNLLILLFTVFFKIGLFTFGGGYAMIPIIKETVIETYKWLSPQEFIDIIAIAEMTPGIIAVNMATFLGTKVSGSPLGGIVATLGVVLPSSVIVYSISHYFSRIKDNLYVEKILMFIGIGVPGIIATAAYSLFETAIIDWSSMILLIISIYLSLKKKINPIIMIIVGGVIGVILY